MQNNEPPYLQLVDMSRWYVVSRAIHTVAQLGVANYMSSTPTPIDDLAQATNSKPALLNRLLKFLSAYGVFNDHHNAYSLTDLSRPLRDDDPYSMRAVLSMVDEAWWQAFSQLDTCIQTGESAFVVQHGMDFFTFLRQHPDKQQNVAQGIAALSRFDDELICNSIDFAQFNRLIDIRGGRSQLSKALAKHYPTLAITLFDNANIIQSLDASAFPKTITLHTGDLLASIPIADAYLFKGVLHDFDESMIRALLLNCAHYMPAHATLLVAEQVIPNHQEPHVNKTMDIVMMTLLTGQQRTLPDWQRLIESAGFVYQACYQTAGIFTVMLFKK